jgi:hypothetical protein
VLTGSPKTVADGLIGWVEETGIDGFNIEYMTSSFPSCSAAAYIKLSTRKARCAKNSTAAGDLICHAITLERDTESATQILAHGLFPCRECRYLVRTGDDGRLSRLCFRL